MPSFSELFYRTARVMRLPVALGLGLVVLAAPAAGRAEDLATAEAAKRAAIIAALPADAAKRVFGRVAEPSAGPPRAIGGYAKGCIAGAVVLPADGANWQVMRPAR